MPVVIRELQIKVNVEEQNRDAPNRPVPHHSYDRDALIEACVEKAVEIMKQEHRR